MSADSERNSWGDKRDDHDWSETNWDSHRRQVLRDAGLEEYIDDEESDEDE